MENLVGRMNVVPQKEIAAVAKGHLLYRTPGYCHQREGHTLKCFGVSELFATSQLLHRTLVTPTMHTFFLVEMLILTATK